MLEIMHLAMLLDHAHYLLKVQGTSDVNPFHTDACPKIRLEKNELAQAQLHETFFYSRSRTVQINYKTKRCKVDFLLVF